MAASIFGTICFLRETTPGSSAVRPSKEMPKALATISRSVSEGTTAMAELEMISTMMAEVRAGQLDPAIANAARGLHVVFLKAYEDNYIMAEMAKLEAKYGLEVAATLPEEQEPSEIDRPA